MLGPAARHGGLERGLAGDTAVLGRRPLGSLLHSVPPAPQGPARRARLLTCADVRGPGQGGGGRDRASIGHHGDWSSCGRRREEGRVGRRAGPERRVPSGLWRPLLFPPPRGCQGRDRSLALPVPRPLRRRPRASPGGWSGGMQRPGPGLQSPLPAPSFSAYAGNFPPKPLTCDHSAS